jgi:hypothetical protein
MPEIHTTDLSTWKRCRRQWAISELARIRPVKKNLNFLLGSAIHKALEVWHETRSTTAALEAFHAYVEEDTRSLREDTPWLYAEQEAEILENIDLGVTMLDGYFTTYDIEEFKVARTKADGYLLEVDFLVPILKPDGKPLKDFMYMGTIDGIIVDQYGYWLLEHKTTAYTSADYLRLSDQNVMYLAHVQTKYPKITPKLRGVYYNFLRKKKPSARIKSPLFFRERIYRNQHEIDSAVSSIYYIARDMTAASKDPNHLCYPTATKDCSWDCSYKTICQAMNDGTDVQSILEASFMTEDESRSKWVSDWRPTNG